MKVQKLSGVIETIRRNDEKGYMVRDLERDLDTMKIVKVHRSKTCLTLQAANTLHTEWLKEGEAKAEIRKARQAKAASAITEPFPTPPAQIIDPTDPQSTAGERDRNDIEKARAAFIRSKWPRTFKAMDSKAEAEIIEKAYLLDVAEFSGITAFSPNDPKLLNQITGALYNFSRRKRKGITMSIDEVIVFHWPELVYLDNKEFAKAVRNLTGITVTPAQAKQRRVRLELSSRCPAGRRPA